MTVLDRVVAASRRHGLWLTALLTVVVFFTLFLVGDAIAVAAAIGSLEWWRVVIVVVLVSTSYALRFLKWEYYLREIGVVVPLRISALVFFSGLMMVVTPGKAGEVWKSWFLRDLRRDSVAETAPVVGAERVTDLLALAAFAFLGVVLYERTSVTVVVVTGVFVAGLVFVQWRSACLWVLSRGEHVPLLGGYVDEVRVFYENAYVLFRPRPLIVAMILSLAAWGLEGVVLWVVLDAFVTGPSVLLALFVFGVGSVVGAASMLPGGLGATEASMVSLLVYEYSRTVAVSATVIVRIGTLWFGALVGTTVFLCYRYVAASNE